jgi:hypothetical protein
MPRYKNAQLQALYDNLLVLAEDISSELYWEGEPRRGAGHRAAFWDGASGKFDFTGPKRSAHVVPGTLSAVCFMAGREFARRQKVKERSLTKQQFIEFLVTRRQGLGGSTSEHNHRRLLATRTKTELQAQYRRILENEKAASAAKG